LVKITFGDYNEQDPQGNPIATAPRYNLKFEEVADDCDGNLDMIVYISSGCQTCANAFDVWDANLVFTFSNNLSLAGTTGPTYYNTGGFDPLHFDPAAPADPSNASYSNMTVTQPDLINSNPQMISINIAHDGTDGPFKTVVALDGAQDNWTPVARIKFTKNSTYGAYNFWWKYADPGVGAGNRTIVYMPPVDVPLISANYDQGVALKPCSLNGLQDLNGTMNHPPSTATLSGSTTICSGSGSPALNITVSNDGTGGSGIYTVVISDQGTTTYGSTNYTSGANIVIIPLPTSTSTYHIVSVVDNLNHCSPATFTGNPVITVYPLPTAQISGDATVCENGTSPDVTFTGIVGDAPFTFTYNINGLGSYMVTTSIGNSVTVSVPTATPGPFTYNLMSVSDMHGCDQTQSGSVTVMVNSLSVAPTSASASPDPICRGQYTDITASGGGGTSYVVEWFDSPTGGTLLYTGNPYHVNPTSTTTYYVGNRDLNPCDNSTARIPVVVSVEDVSLHLKAYLQGPWNGTDMNTYLVNPVVYIPTSSPYSAAYPGSGATVASGFFTGKNVVDWIVVGLRNNRTDATFGWKSGFLMNDGSIKDLDATSDLSMPAAYSGQSYWIVVVHRNHLGIVSNGAIPIGCTTSYDFTTPAGQAYGTNPQKYFSAANVYAMWAGDACGVVGDGMGNGQVNANDWHDWYNTNGLLGYHGGDMNLDSSDDSYDTNTFWAPNNGKASQAWRYPVIYIY
jgi:hypothetical protein